MRELIKYKLDFSKTLNFFKDRMNGGNCLNSLLFENTNLNKGSFYTLLPKEANITCIYEFSCGGILPSNPVEDIYVKGLNETFKGEKINSIAVEIAFYIDQIISLNSNLSCIFDDVSSTYNSDYQDPLFLLHGVHYKKEIYYIITEKKSSSELIYECLKSSNAFWHSLGLIFEGSLNDINLTLDKMKYICLKTKLIFVGAYDGEGYVFWEKDEVNNG